MRDRIIDTLGDLAHSRFLVYLMGPYKPFDIESVLDGTAADDALDVHRIPDAVDLSTLVGSDVDLDKQEAVFDLLLFVRDRLRTEPGVNAFLAVDIDIPLVELDAATQSIEFALASNAVVYVIPKLGDNLGVGIETGAVLEALYRERRAGDPAHLASHHERVLFIHESGVGTSLMAAVHDRWEARVYSYTDREDLVRQVRLFVRDLARREQHGALPTLDASGQ